MINDSASVEKVGLKPIFDVMEQLGLPREIPMNDENAPELNLDALSGAAHRIIGINLLVNFYISEDVRDTTHNRMMVRASFHF